MEKDTSPLWFFVAGGAVSVILAGCFFYFGQSPSLGSAASNQAGYATSSTIQVGPDLDKTLFAENRDCANRVISTVASPVMLSFHSTINPSGTLGHVQAASTTVEYDSDLFGCRAVTAYAFSSTTISLIEFSQ